MRYQAIWLTLSPLNSDAGTFGQMTAWDLEKAMKGARKLPHDVQRIASAETLRTLKSPAVPKWRCDKRLLSLGPNLEIILLPAPPIST